MSLKKSNIAISELSPTNRDNKWPLATTSDAALFIEVEPVNEAKLTQTGCCTQKPVSFSSGTHAVIGFDWITLEIFPMQAVSEIRNTFLFDIEREYWKGKNWEKIYKVITLWNGSPEVFATLETENVEKAYRNCHLKIENKWLYSPQFNDILSSCCSELKFKFLSISRIDPYIDFQNMAGNLAPQTFIRGNFNADYLKAGRARRMNHATGKEYTPVDMRFIGQEKHTTQVDTVYWGSRSAGFQIRMYNKTVHMAKVLHKPWVKSQWDAAGFNGEKDTWRLEFEVHTKAFAKMDPQTGEMIACMRTLDTITEKNITEFVQMLFYRHFKFHRRKVTVNGKRIVYDDRKRRLPEFYPLHLENCGFLKVPLPYEKSYGRSERIQVTKLVKHYLEVKDEATNVAQSVKGVIDHIVGKHGLYYWFLKKFDHIDFGPDFMKESYWDIYLAREMQQGSLQLEKLSQKTCPVCHR